VGEVDPFARIYLKGALLFGVEAWVDGLLMYVVPASTPHSLWSASIMESQTPSQPRPPTAGHAKADWSRRLDDIQHERRNHPAGRTFYRWLAYERLLDVHHGNRQELVSVLDSLDNPRVAIEMVQNVAPPHVRDRVEAELDRSLFNYLSSHYSLTDQAKKLAHLHPHSNLERRLEKRLTGLRDEGDLAFVNGLRNYTTHHTLPFLGHSVSIKGQHGPVEYTASLNAEELLVYREWSGPAKDFLRASNPGVDVRMALRRHVDEYFALFDWLVRCGHALCRGTAIDLDELASEFNWTLTRGRVGHPRRTWRMSNEGMASEAPD